MYAASTKHEAALRGGTNRGTNVAACNLLAMHLFSTCPTSLYLFHIIFSLTSSSAVIKYHAWPSERTLCVANGGWSLNHECE